MTRGHLRRLLPCLLAALMVALVGAGRASAGYGVAPNGQSFTVTVDASGAVKTPAAIDLVVYLDAQDSAPEVWVSDSAEIGPTGSPAASLIGYCSAGMLIPSAEQYKSVCRVTTTLMKPGRTYYWWLEFQRQEPGQPVPTGAVSGPFSFSLVQQQAAPPPADPPKPPPPHTGVSTKTVASAATLPGGTVFNGRRSIKHTTLTRLVYRTMNQLGLPRQLAFACWNRADWVSVLAAEGAEPERGLTTLLGFWLGRQPRWLHLAPQVCTDVQGLLATKRPNARRAGALSTVIHETLHAYGIANEAQTNCFAVQLVPVFGINLGMSPTRAGYLGTLARNYVRKWAPQGYWNGARCRDGGAWDLLPGPNLR